jgi:PrtD family type I secretion system ABC transporter
VFAVTRDKLSEALAGARSAFVLVGLFSLFINLAMLIAPLYMLQVYDRVLTAMSRDTLVMLSLLAGGLLLLNTFVDVARSRLLVRIGSRLDAQLNRPLFETVLRHRLQGAQDPLGPNPATLDSASQSLRDLATLRTFLTGAGILALFDAPWTPIYIGLIYLFHPLLGSIALAGAVVILALAIGSEIAARGPLRVSGIASRRSNDFVDSVARNAEAVHAMGMVGNLQRRWRADHEAGVAWQAAASDRVGLINAVAKFVRMGLQVAILGVGAWLVIDQVITGGVMVAASIIMGRALAPVQAAIGGWRGVIEARSARQRLKRTLAVRRDDAAHIKLPTPEGKLFVEDVILRLPGVAEPVLRHIGFTLQPGESLGLIGPSGAGKSSLARLLVGIWRPSYGTVRLDGAEIAAWPKEDVGPSLGYMPQEVELLDGTVGENIARFGEPESEKVVKAAKLAGTHDLILNLPDGYETRIGGGGCVLSRGQRQRIALARAMYGDPRLIVLDEPNASLDFEGESALRRALLQMQAQGATLVVISHKPSLLASVDKLLVLKDGRVDRFGPRDEITAAMPAPVAPARRPGFPFVRQSKRGAKSNVAV